MNDFKEKLSKVKWSAFFSLALYSTLFVLLNFYLIRNCIDQAPIIQDFSVLVWIIATIAWTYFYWLDLTNKKRLTEVENVSSNSLLEKEEPVNSLPELIALFVISIPIIVILIIVLTNVNYTQTQLTSNPKFKSFGDWANILFGLLYISEARKKLFEIKKRLTKQIIKLIELMVILAAIITYMTYIVHLIEVPS